MPWIPALSGRRGSNGPPGTMGRGRGWCQLFSPADLAGPRGAGTRRRRSIKRCARRRSGLNGPGRILFSPGFVCGSPSSFGAGARFSTGRREFGVYGLLMGIFIFRGMRAGREGALCAGESGFVGKEPWTRATGSFLFSDGSPVQLAPRQTIGRDNASERWNRPKSSLIIHCTV